MHSPQKAPLRQTQLCKPFICYKTLFYLVAHSCSPHHQHGWVERPFCPKSIFFVLANTMRWNFYNGLISRNICSLLNFFVQICCKKIWQTVWSKMTIYNETISKCFPKLQTFEKKSTPEVKICKF